MGPPTLRPAAFAASTRSCRLDVCSLTMTPSSMTATATASSGISLDCRSSVSSRPRFSSAVVPRRVGRRSSVDREGHMPPCSARNLAARTTGLLGQQQRAQAGGLTRPPPVDDPELLLDEASRRTVPNTSVEPSFNRYVAESGSVAAPTTHYACPANAIVMHHVSGVVHGQLPLHDVHADVVQHVSQCTLEDGSELPRSRFDRHSRSRQCVHRVRQARIELQHGRPPKLGRLAPPA